MVLQIAILLSMLLYINATPVMTREKMLLQQTCASTFKINQYYYTLEETKNISGVPADMTVHWKTGKLFFTLITETMKMNLHVAHPGGEIDEIKVTGVGQSTAVDNLNDIIYLATDNGVFKYKDDSTTEPYTATGEDVMYIAVSNTGNTLYIATWPQNRVSKITNDGQKIETFSLIPNGHGLTVDTRDNIYFTASKTSYMLKSGQTVPIRINGLPSDKIVGIFVSRSDEVYAMDENSQLYLVDPDNASAARVGNFKVKGVNAFAIDGFDNVFIGVKDAIMKFAASETNPCDERMLKLQTAKVQLPYNPLRPVKPLLSPVLPAPKYNTQMSPVKSGKPGKPHGRRRKIHKKTATTTTTEAIDEEDD